MLSLLVASVAALVVLAGAALVFFLPTFGEVSLWQVLAYAGSPLTLLSAGQLRVVWLCVGLSVVAFVLVGWAHARILRVFRRRYGKRGAWCVHLSFLVFLGEAAFLVYSYADLRLGIRRELRCLARASDLFRAEFKEVSPDGVVFGRKRNLVVLVGESIEESFLDGSAFGTNLMPRLTRWRAGHASFGGMTTVDGNEHTVSSLFGLAYGAPRLPVDAAFRWTSFSDYPEVRFPNVFDIWLRNGFTCRFVQGGEIGFACTHKVFAAVPGVEVYDRAAFADDPGYLGEPSKHPYGVHDEVVIAKRLPELTSDLAGCGQPFVLMAWTLNTHGSEGWVSSGTPRCRATVLEDAVRAADDLIVDYLTWLERQPFAKETTVVFLGDHAFHGVFSGLPRHGRTMVTAVANSCGEIRPGRRFAAFDWAPTFLELTGARLPNGRFGLGTSLLGKRMTLLERIGCDRYETEIRSCGPDYRRSAFGW